MRYFIISFFLFLCIPYVNAQSDNEYQNNALSFELGKTGLIYNLTFDHKLLNTNFGFHLGIGSSFAKYLRVFATGGGVYYLLGKNKNFLETGIDLNYLSVDEVSNDQKGFALIYPDYTINTLYTSVNIGYRKYGKAGMFRIGMSPGFFKDGFVPGAYISYGFTF
ncbi:MAG: hypothetical protein ABI237_03550 [Ginsengibacter sp.]